MKQPEQEWLASASSSDKRGCPEGGRQDARPWSSMRLLYFLTNVLLTYGNCIHVHTRMGHVGPRHTHTSREKHVTSTSVTLRRHGFLVVTAFKVQ